MNGWWLRLGYGRQPNGIDFKAIDGQPVYHFFLALAPPLETSNVFLPVLGKIAEVARDPDVLRLLSKVETPEQFLELMGSREIDAGAPITTTPPSGWLNSLIQSAKRALRAFR